MHNLKSEIERYINYQEEGDGKKIYDSYNLPFIQYLQKYYRKLNFDRWNDWMEKFVKPSFCYRDGHMQNVSNLNYISDNIYDFEEQNKLYDILNREKRLDEDLRMFIAFMGGAGFFNYYQINLETWFSVNNWVAPSSDIRQRRSINEILNYTFGLNFIKDTLTQLPYWECLV